MQVTFFGSGLPTPRSLDFEDCGPTTFGSKPVNDDCYAYGPGNKRSPGDATTPWLLPAILDARLRVKCARVRDGKVIGRDNIQIGSLDRPAGALVHEDVPRRVRCQAALASSEARACVGGAETDLIATGSIDPRGSCPSCPISSSRSGPDVRRAALQS